MLRGGFAEGAGKLVDGPPFTFKLGVEPTENGMGVVVYESRLYGPAGLPWQKKYMIYAVSAMGRPAA